MARVRSTDKTFIISSRLSFEQDVLDLPYAEEDTYNNTTQHTRQPSFDQQEVFQPNGAPIVVAKSKKFNVIELNQQTTEKHIAQNNMNPFRFNPKSLKKS